MAIKDYICTNCSIAGEKWYSRKFLYHWWLNLRWELYGGKLFHRKMKRFQVKWKGEKISSQEKAKDKDSQE